MGDYLVRQAEAEMKSEYENAQSEKKWEAHFNWDEPNYRFDEEAWSEVEQERNLNHAQDNSI
jgi:hypothetical protein